MALGTGFAIVLGLVILMSFEVYSTVNEAARTEAVSTNAMFNDEHVFAADDQRVLQGDLVCCARAVIYQEWPSMEESDTASATVDIWAARLDSAVRNITIDGPKQQVNYAAMLGTAGAREDARQTRLLEAESVLPNLFWLVLLTGAFAVIGFMFFWADSGERKRVQVLMIGSVTGLITASLLLVSLLDSPIGSQVGKIHPTEMMHTQTLMQAQIPADFKYACDAQGEPTA
ncbi:MAG: DUF4239 domain-containing protein [Actinomycetota bacterium]|nr:DUF4239 domain-containing protein [Actinomycetota bacterium]